MLFLLKDLAVIVFFILCEIVGKVLGLDSLSVVGRYDFICKIDNYDYGVTNLPPR